LLDVFDEHIDGSLRVELWEDVEHTCKIAPIAPLVALKQGSDLRG
jgi:hypothetical protein